MAQELEDGEFWLPSDFLTDDDPLTDFKTDYLKTKGRNDFPHGFGGSFGFNSDLNSPVESVLGSTETESDEDNFVAGLTREIAHTTLQDSNLFSDYKPKEWKLSTSPQSTLCACKQGPGLKRVTRVSSPLEQKDVGWDLLYTAGEKVANMCITDETTSFHLNNVFALAPKSSHVALPAKKPTPTTGLYPAQAQPQADIVYTRMQATEQMMNRGVWGQGKFEHQFHNGNMTGEAERSQSLSMASWPTLQQSQLQQQRGSGMRAVFLRETGVKKERTGTGVFLPRNFGTNSAETPKKTAGYSTVLIPERVVHALNLNIDSIDAHSQHRGNRSFALKQRSNDVMMAQREAVMNKELGLFQDWPY